MHVVHSPGKDVNFYLYIIETAFSNHFQNMSVIIIYLSTFGKVLSKSSCSHHCYRY